MSMRRYLICIILSVFSICIFAQDPNWYVKNGEVAAGTNVGDAIMNDVRIGNMAFPSPMSFQARDDIFIIFDDGTCYLERQDRPWKYSHASSPTSLSLRSQASEIEYMYHTNVYDDEDLPDTLDITKSILNNPVNTIKPTVTPLVTANHTAVPGRDITLVVNVSESNHRSEALPTTFILKYDTYSYSELLDQNGGVNTQTLAAAKNVGPLFQPSYVFNHGAEPSFVYPLDVTDIGGGQGYTEFFINSSFEGQYYINLKPTETMREIIAQEAMHGPTVSIFKLIYETEIMPYSDTIYYAETNGNTHDPNFIRASAMCDDNNTIYYNGQFFNATETSATGLGFDFVLNNELDANTAKTSMTIKLEDASGSRSLQPGEYTIDVNNQLVQVELDKTIAINTRGSDTTFVKFEFIAKSKDSNGLPQDADIADYMTKDAFVFFAKNVARSTQKYYLNNQFLDCANHQVVSKDEHGEVKSLCQLSKNACCSYDDGMPDWIWIPILIILLFIFPILKRFTPFFDSKEDK